jgi:hypothetical protein
MGVVWQARDEETGRAVYMVPAHPGGEEFT